MAKFLEYQGKTYLKEAGIPIPGGEIAQTPEEARKIAEKIGGSVVVKAQVLAGGRGKAGGIKIADTPEEAENAAKNILGMEIKGLKVNTVLIYGKLDIAKEFYAGIIINSSRDVRAPVLMFSTEGGMEIEAVPEDKIAMMNIDVIRGLRPYDTLNMVRSMGIKGNELRQLADVTYKLYTAFRRYDCRMIEINPLALLSDGKVCAIDCRFQVDDQAIFRHRELGVSVGREFVKDPTEFDLMAWKFEEADFRGTSYVAEMATPEEMNKGGHVGYHGIGGGAAILGVDALNKVGLNVADYADTSGNPTASKVYRVAKIILAQPGIEGFFLAGFMMANQEQWHHAHGLVKALREELPKRPGFPVVLLLCGNKETESQQILKEGLADLPGRIEIYDREHVYDAKYLATRFREMVDEYKAEQGK